MDVGKEEYNMQGCDGTEYDNLKERGLVSICKSNIVLVISSIIKSKRKGIEMDLYWKGFVKSLLVG